MKKNILWLLSLAPLIAAAQLKTNTLTETENILQYYVSALAHDSMQGRATGSQGMLKAAHFIANEMKSAGLKPISQLGDYFELFEIKGRDTVITGVNVMGAVQGKSLKDELVIFCAHYDHIGTSAETSSNDTIYNGANDNASGVAAILQLAKKINELKPERTILFIAFSGEEMGLIGSSEFVQNLKSPTSIKAVFNFDMVGRGNSAFITGSYYGNLRSMLNKELKLFNADKYGAGFFRKDPSNRRNSYFERSDNYPFAQLGIPAYTIMSTEDTDKHYHQLSDHTETLDFKRMAETVEAIFIAGSPIINGKLTPQRIRVY